MSGNKSIQAALLLVDAWQETGRVMFQLGKAEGYIEGYAAAERQMAEAWRAAIAPIKRVLAKPTQAELQHRRGEAA